jgi:hypothetical protein
MFLFVCSKYFWTFAAARLVENPPLQNRATLVGPSLKAIPPQLVSTHA